MNYKEQSCWRLLANYVKQKWCYWLLAILAIYGICATYFECLQIIPCHNANQGNDILLSICTGYLTGFFVYVLTSWLPDYKRSSLELSIMAEELRYIKDDYWTIIGGIFKSDPFAVDKEGGVTLIKESICCSSNNGHIVYDKNKLQILIKESPQFEKRLGLLQHYSSWFTTEETMAYFRLSTNIFFKLLQYHFVYENNVSSQKQLDDLCNGIIDFYNDVEFLRTSIIRRSMYFCSGTNNNKVLCNSIINTEKINRIPYKSFIERCMNMTFKISISLTNSNNNEAN